MFNNNAITVNRMFPVVFQSEHFIESLQVRVSIIESWVCFKIMEECKGNHTEYDML